MSKIEMKDIIDNAPKNKKRLIPKAYLIIFSLLCLIFASVIMIIISNLIDLPFQAGSRNISVVVQDSVDIKEVKIKQVQDSFLIILPNSFWDHTNYTDIDYSRKTIALAVNNVLGYDDKLQTWDYFIADDGQSEIVSVRGKLIMDNVKYEANIQFNIIENTTYFYNLYLKEDRRRARIFPATPKQKSLLIQMMYRS